MFPTQQPDADDLFNPDDRKESGILPTSFNFANSIIGAGIIGLPYALLECGFWLGLIMLVGLALVIDWCVVCVCV